MNTSSIIFLSIIQGLTEFLPISSSGHLVIIESFFMTSKPDATLEVFLHTGTLFAVLLYYREAIAEIFMDLVNLRFKSNGGRLGLFLLLATIPATVVGMMFRATLESIFQNAYFAAAMLIITSLILFSTHLIKRNINFKWNFVNSFIIGFAQVFAMLPGISRSGITIVAALWLGASGEDATEFSFLLAVPAIIGVTVIKIFEVVSGTSNFYSVYSIGIIISAIVGYVSLTVLVPIVRSGKLWIFGIYCLLIGILSIIFAK